MPITGREVAALISVAVAAAALTARRGEPEPGNLVAPTIVLLGVGALIAQPALDITLFIGGPGDPHRRVWWVGIVVAATIVLLIAFGSVVAAGSHALSWSNVTKPSRCPVSMAARMISDNFI